MKITMCNKCGCARQTIVIAPKIKSNLTGIVLGLKSLCFPCLLQLVHISWEEIPERLKSCVQNFKSVERR